MSDLEHEMRELADKMEAVSKKLHAHISESYKAKIAELRTDGKDDVADLLQYELQDLNIYLTQLEVTRARLETLE